MAVGASKPTVVADGDGFFTIKNKMLVSSVCFLVRFLHQYFDRGMVRLRNTEYHQYALQFQKSN